MGRDDMSEAQKQFEEAVRKFAVYMFNDFDNPDQKRACIFGCLFTISVAEYN